jgi:hypothetical protein
MRFGDVGFAAPEAYVAQDGIIDLVQLSAAFGARALQMGGNKPISLLGISMEGSGQDTPDFIEGFGDLFLASEAQIPFRRPFSKPYARRSRWVCLYIRLRTVGVRARFRPSSASGIDAACERLFAALWTISREINRKGILPMMRSAPPA